MIESTVLHFEYKGKCPKKKSKRTSPPEQIQQLTPLGELATAVGNALVHFGRTQTK